jgi:hypothetical protein
MSMRIIRAAICVGFFVLARTQIVGAQPFDFETTIRQPVVTAPVHEYPDILFQAGDRIFLDAGGCVQTGGAGKTWKRYVDPSGEAADRLYHGLVFVPGVTPGLVRIGGVINRPLDVPVGMGPGLHLTSLWVTKTVMATTPTTGTGAMTMAPRTSARMLARHG